MSDEDRQLDELLARVSWPAMSEEASLRLQATLRQSVPLARPRRIRLTPLALAASVLIAVGAAFLATRSQPEIAPVVVQSVPIKFVPAQSVVVAWRPATMYERLLIRADVQRSVAKIKPPIPSPVLKALSDQVASASPKPSIQSIRAQISRELERRPVELDRVLVEQFASQAGAGDLALLRRVITTEALDGAAYPALLARRDPAAADLVIKLIQDPQTRGPMLAALHAAPSPPTDLLMARLSAPLVDERLAAARALGSICQGPTLDALKTMVSRDIHRREALAALLSCHDPSAGEYLSKLKNQPAIRAQLLAVQDEMKALF